MTSHDTGYMARHQQILEAALSKAINETAKAKPANPVAFLAQRLAVRGAAAEPGDSNRDARGGLDLGGEKLVLPADDDAAGSWSLISWLAGAGFHRVVAGAFQRAASARGFSADNDGALGFVRSIKSRSELATLLCSETTTEAVTDLAWEQVMSLQNSGAATNVELQSKFAGAIELSYGGLDTFFGGLEAIVGSPNPKLFEGMAADHTDGPGTESTDTFVAGNYGVQTSSKVEWFYGVDADATPAQFGLDAWPAESEEKLPDRAVARKRQPIDELWSAAKAHNEALEQAKEPPVLKEEVIAANQYTGPVRMSTRNTSLGSCRRVTPSLTPPPSPDPRVTPYTCSCYWIHPFCTPHRCLSSTTACYVVCVPSLSSSRR